MDKLDRTARRATAPQQAGRRVLQQRPGDAARWLQLAQTRLETGDAAAAQTAAARAFALQPASLAACKLLARCLQRRGLLNELVDVCERLPADVPRDAELLLLQAQALALTRRAAQAVPLLTRLLKLDLRNAQAHYQIGLALSDLDMGAQAAVCFETALLTDPDGHAGVRSKARSRLVLLLAQMCDWARLSPQLAALRAQLDRPDDAELAHLTPFMLMALGFDAAQQLRTARLRCGLLRGRALPPTPRRRRPGRLRIGYLSSDFRRHATAMLMTEMLEGHDRERFEVFLYCHTAADGSAEERRIRAAADHHRPLAGLSDIEAAQRMRADGIDIAVDLKGHTHHSRMQILAARPAPVQVSYLGFPGTTGADFLDYVVGDVWVTPLAHAAHYSERIAQMPHSYQPNDSKRELPPPPRAALGLPADAWVLCCFNQSYKFTPEVADCWAAILRAVPGAVLWLLAWNREAQANLARELAARGVAGERLVFSPLVDTAAHMARLQCADLFLDTWPCNAHTTASEALWAGVPVLTVPGETFASRVAASLVQACALPEFVCADAGAYVDKAVALLRDAQALRAAQRHLREHRPSLPLFDSARYTRDFEALLLRMWARHAAGLAPDHLPAQATLPATQAAAPLALP